MISNGGTATLGLYDFKRQVDSFGEVNYFQSGTSYLPNARVMLDNGEIVQNKTVGNLTNNPNIDMNGWVLSKSYSLIQKTQISYDDKFRTLGDIKDFGAVSDGVLHTLQEWVDAGKFSNLTAIQMVYENATSLTDSIDSVVIQKFIDDLPYSPESTHMPKGYMNGGVVRIPSGRYTLNKRIKLKRGVRLSGESRESTQLIGYTINGLFYYEDEGRYLPDEFVIENISLWQHESVVPTSGAAISFKHTGLVPEASISVKLDNLIIEGFYNNLIIGDGINLQIGRIDQSKAISDGAVIDSQFFTTSSIFGACYAHSNGGSGWLFKKLYYVDIIGMASDSNVKHGYEFHGCRSVTLHGGAEANGKKALFIKDSYGTVATIGAVNNLECAVELDASFYTTLLGGILTGTSGTAVTGVNGSNRLKIIGTGMEGNYTANRVSGVDVLDDQAISTAIQTNGKNWSLGLSGALQTSAQFQFGGVVDAVSVLDLQTTFNPTGTPVGQYTSHKITWRGLSAFAFPIAVGSYITNALISGGGSIARKIGKQIDKQTGGTSANAALFLSMGNALAVGNWSVFNDIDLPSYFKDKIKFGASAPTAPYIASGVGAPSDSTAPTGSIYTRTDGGTGTTLYIREGSVWVAK